MQKERVVFIDYIRVIACFLVILVHASENFYAADVSGIAGNISMLANESNRFWVSFYDGFWGRISVPLFMIVSAFLLVPMKEGCTMLQFYKRRFSHILPPMLIFMLLYTFLPLAVGRMSVEQSIADLKTLPFNFPSMAGHLWFMYPLISLYLIIPVVSPWLEKSTAKEESVFLLLFLASTFMPWIHLFIRPEIWGECFWNNFSMLWYCSGFLGYLVMAHYVRKHLKWNTKTRLTAGSVCFIAGAAFTGWSFWLKGLPGQIIETPLLEWGWQFCTPNVLCASFGAFILFSCIKKKESPKIIGSLSNLSFGIYLIHLFFLSLIAPVIVNGNPDSPLVPVWLAIPLIAVLTFICSWATSWLISKLPFSKYIIGFRK